jgi:chorismate-pyruvate lyase
LLTIAMGADADAATGSATAKTGINNVMNPNAKIAQKADTALGATLFAIQAFGRPSLLVLANRMLPSETSFETYSDEGLRRLLRKRAKELRKKNPVQLIDLDRYIDDYSRTQLAKAGD